MLHTIQYEETRTAGHGCDERLDGVVARNNVYTEMSARGAHDLVDGVQRLDIDPHHRPLDAVDDRLGNTGFSHTTGSLNDAVTVCDQRIINPLDVGVTTEETRRLRPHR